MVSEDQWGAVVLLGKVKGLREWLTDGDEQLSCLSLHSSAALTFSPPNYTTIQPCFLIVFIAGKHVLFVTLHDKFFTRDFSHGSQ